MWAPLSTADSVLGTVAPLALAQAVGIRRAPFQVMTDGENKTQSYLRTIFGLGLLLAEIYL